GSVVFIQQVGALDVKPANAVHGGELRKPFVVFVCQRTLQAIASVQERHAGLPSEITMIARGARARGSRLGGARLTLDAVYECTYHPKRRIGPPPLANAGNTRKGMKREYDFSKAKRGPVVKVPKGKTRITIRLDDDVLAWFRRMVILVLPLGTFTTGPRFALLKSYS